MNRSDNLYITALLFLIIFMLSYCLILQYQPPLPRYYPLEHSWNCRAIKGIPSMYWYSMQALALAIASVAIVTFPIHRMLSFAPPALAVRMLGIIAIIVTTASIVFVCIHELMK